MAVVIASGLRKEFSGDVLFDGVSFKVERADRLALAGPNGAGKTTLLRALAGEGSLEGGELAWQKGARVALHDQRPPDTSSRPLREYVLSGTADLAAVEEELRVLEAAMSSGDHGAATLRRYTEAQARLEHAGGYDWRDRAASVVRGLGFTDDDLDRPLQTFSGGELTRASLARALASQPDLLLLDEPTNHLDIESLEWLEQMLKTLDAAVILVAHDRWFLEAVTTAVLEVEGGKSIYFPGAWHVWRREQAARAIHQTKTAARQAEQLERLERFVERFRYKASKAKQAQARVKQIKKLEADRVHAPDGRRRSLGFEFLKPARSGRDVLVVEGLSLQAGDKQLLDDASFAIERGEHVALVGPNGSGKTTLLETLLGRREPKAGKIRLGHGVEAAYFSQHEAELDERGSVLDAAMFGTGLKRPEAQKLLGRFLFSGWDEHEKPVVALSGGERRRLALAIVVASGANFLVLDEPTNHLDLGVARVTRGGARGVSGHGAARLARPRAARRRRRPAARGRGPHDRVVSGRLGRLRPCAGGRRGRRARRRRSRRSRSRSGRRSRRARRSSSSRRRWRAPRSASRSSSGSWPTTGATPRSSPRIATRARTSRRCSAAGKRCSKRADRRLRDRVEHEDHLVARPPRRAPRSSSASSSAGSGGASG